MIDGVGLPQVGLGSGWALVAVFVILVFRGSLVPRRTYDDMVHDRDEWRTESRVKDQQIQVKDEQLGHLGEVGRTVDHIMRALPHGSDEVKS